MTRKVQSSQLGISIFPFLAVLLCAMGALIVLLVVVNRASRNVAIAAHKETLKKQDGPKSAVAATNANPNSAAPKPDLSTATTSVNTVAAANDEKVLQEQLSKVKDAKEEVQFRRDTIKKAHEARHKELQDERQRLSIAEEQYRKLTDQYDTLRKVVADLATADATTANSRAQLEAELNRSKSELEASRKKLTDAQLAAQSRKPNFAVVPYDGPNRTNRRPIYIECTADSIIVQPEGIRMSPRDFVGPNGPGNPLASVMRAVREQYIAASPNPKSPDAEPYPLFLVRPEGIEAYMIAREAMQSYAIEVGYQTVDQDWELAYPAADPNVAQRATQALDESRQRVGAYVALNGAGAGGGTGAGGTGGGGSIAGSGLSRGGSGSGRTSYNLSKKSGRLIPDDPTPKISSGAPARPGTFAALDDEQGVGSGGNGSGGSGPGGTGSGSGLPGGGGSQQNPYGAIGGYGTGYGPGGTGSGLPGTGLAGTGTSGSGLPGSGLPGNGVGGNNLGVGGSNYGAGGTGFAQGGTGTGGFAQGGTGTYGGTSAGVGGNGFAGNGTTGSGTAGNPNGGYGAGGSGTGGNGVAGSGTSGNGSGSGSGGYGTGANGSASNGNGTGGTGAPGTGSDSFASGNGSTGGGTSGSNNYSGSGSPGQQSGAPNGTAGSSSSNLQGGNYASGSSSGQGYSGSGTPSGPTFNGDPSKRRFGELEQRGTYSSSDEPSYSDGNPSTGASSSRSSPPPEEKKPKREKPKSLASSRGQGWGVSDRTSRSNPVTRPLLLKVDASYLTLPADLASDSVETKIPLDTITERSSNTFIPAIEQRIKRWGIAGKLLYWSPELTFEISPDGEGRFEDIQALLEGSGWTVKRKNPPGQIFSDTKPAATITQQQNIPATNGTTNPSLGPMIPQANLPGTNTIAPQRGLYPLVPATTPQTATPQTATQHNSINAPATIRK